MSTNNSNTVYRLMMQYELYSIMLLYVLMIAGGLWHILGMLQRAMHTLSSPMIILLGCIPAWLSMQEHLHKQRFLLWCTGVWIASTLYEWAGIHSGIIFGQYAYGSILFPVVDGVTLVIGFAWMGTLLCSSAVVERCIRVPWHTLHGGQQIMVAIAVGFVMMCFDGCMEYAAVRLGYWQWSPLNSEQGLLVLYGVPLRNYLAWWLGGSIFAYVGLRSGALAGGFHRWTFHSYTAQLAYFVMVYFA